MRIHHQIMSKLYPKLDSMNWATVVVVLALALHIGFVVTAGRRRAHSVNIHVADS